MNWTVTYLAQHEVISVYARSVVDFDAFRQAAPDIKQAASDHKAHRFLYDFREADFRLSTTDIYELPGLAASVGLGYQRQVAFVVSPSTAPKQDLEFLEHRYLNYGVLLRLFPDSESALQWLASPTK